MRPEPGGVPTQSFASNWHRKYGRAVPPVASRSSDGVSPRIAANRPRKRDAQPREERQSFFGRGITANRGKVASGERCPSLRGEEIVLPTGKRRESLRSAVGRTVAVLACACNRSSDRGLQPGVATRCCKSSSGARAASRASPLLLITSHMGPLTRPPPACPPANYLTQAPSRGHSRGPSRAPSDGNQGKTPGADAPRRRASVQWDAC